jgi:hypothetical protein
VEIDLHIAVAMLLLDLKHIRIVADQGRDSPPTRGAARLAEAAGAIPGAVVVGRSPRPG